MLDKNIPFKDVIMKMDYAKVRAMNEPALPEGFRFRFFADGDEAHWARIETSVLEFKTADDAKKYFARSFLPYPDELKKRCVFVVNRDGLPVATTTAWFSERESGCQASIQWVSVCPSYQGIGLGKAIVQKALTIFPMTDPGGDVWLHTQTWSHVAIRMYDKLGFHMIKTSTFFTTGSYPEKAVMQKNSYAEAMEVLKGIYDANFWQKLANSAE